jgi:hypothetical protein
MRIKNKLAATLTGVAIATGLGIAVPAAVADHGGNGTCVLARDGGIKFCHEWSLGTINQPYGYVRMQSLHTGQHNYRVWLPATNQNLGTGSMVGAGDIKYVFINPGSWGSTRVRVSIDPDGCCTNAAFNIELVR